MGRLTLIFACISLLLAPGQALSLGQCDRPLGMESGEIADSQITASSSHNGNSVGAHSGRIRTEHRGGAWCPLPVITDQVHEYLQIDLGRLTVVTAAETQGRFGNGHGVEWAERYSLEYWRPGWDADAGWRTYRNTSGHTLMDGNENSYLAAKMALNPPLIASMVRVVPRSQHPRTVCLRAELHGCLYTDGIRSYSMDRPDPSRPDLTYDGTGSAEVMEDGLGQLTDGHEGGDDITKPEWVGWKTRPGQLVTVTFEFDSVRELEAAEFHVSNHFTSGVRMFRRASLYFSVDGTEYTSTPLTLEPQADRIFEDSRRLEVRLYRQVGRFVRLQMTAADRWLLVSEITFDSAPSSHNVTGLVTSRSGDRSVSAPPAAESESESESTPESEGAESGESAASLAVLLAVLGLVLLLLSALVGYVVRAGRRRRVAGGAPGARPLPLPLARNLKELRLSMQLTPRHGYSRPPDVGDEDKLDLAADQYRVVRLNSEYNTPGHRQTDTTADTTYDYAVPVVASGPGQCSDGAPAVLGTAPRSWDNPNYRQSPHNTTQSSSQPSVCSISELLPSPPPLPPPPPQPASCSGGRRRRLLAGSVQGVTGTCVWDGRGAVQPQPQPTSRAAITEICPDTIQLRDKIGHGHYGEIRVCEVHCRSSPDSAYQAPSRLATARTLWPSASADAAARLRLEADPLCRVTDRHVTRLLGLCTLDQSPGLLVEYMENGDLNEFLRRAAHDNSRGHGPLELDSLVYISQQIAAGMEHLESLGIIHGDLAARNCLVGHQLKVKVGDLGPSRSQYATDYVTLADGRVLPLRWRAPEAIFTEEISSRSDVWSFSVTLWEVLTWCRLQPLAHLADSAVTDRLASYRDPCLEPHLQQPNACPPELYQLMIQCWRLHPQARPSFKEIRAFLQRRNGNFAPVAEDL